MTSGRLFWDFSESYGQIIVVALFEIISDQGASNEIYERSRRICLVFQFLLQSSGVWPRIFEKVNAPAIFLDFFGPAGGSAPGKMLRPHWANKDVMCALEVQMCFAIISNPLRLSFGIEHDIRLRKAICGANHIRVYGSLAYRKSGLEFFLKW